MFKIAKENKWFNQTYINEIKTKLGHSADSLNLTVSNNPNTWGRQLLFGAFSSLSLRMYNLSLENKGLLFIQRSMKNNQLLLDNSHFINHHEIAEITFKKGLIQNKLIIINNEGKKRVYLCNKKIIGVPWHKESYEKVQACYGN
ncbi:hypothetical protein ACWN8P_00665 [Vagococcus salmoninarum]|uniref:YokE-like PH domain-containing protein n=1 Tax=Vagococcus salmoninarum TaxID=2739 RepID=A0A429ZW53_9ENTE|nr:hypothetical protein [Vagococcus salmoninarum]RST97876.1 hypothetical protein CBF35_00875 [Vagococcus salmoninarum]